MARLTCRASSVFSLSGRILSAELESPPPWILPLFEPQKKRRMSFILGTFEGPWKINEQRSVPSRDDLVRCIDLSTYAASSIRGCPTQFSPNRFVSKGLHSVNVVYRREIFGPKAENMFIHCKWKELEVNWSAKSFLIFRHFAKNKKK